LGLSDSTVLNPVLLVAGPKIYQLNVVDSNQCKAAVEVKFGDGILTSKAKADTLKGCKPLTINFENKSYRSEKSTWFWGNGDSTLSNSGNMSFTFQQAGLFKVVLKAENDTACQKIDFDTLLVQVFDLPLFSDTLIRFCENGSQILKAAKNQGISFKWTPSFGLNDSILKEPVFIIAEPRLFSVSISDSNFCSVSAKVDVRDGRLKSEFAVGILNPCAPVIVDLNNLSTNPQRSRWIWDSDSVEVLENETTPIFFNKAGVFKIKLKVFSDSACNVFSESEKEIVLGGVPAIPMVTFPFCPGDSVVLNVLKSSGYQYVWPGFTIPDKKDSSQAKIFAVDTVNFSVGIQDSLKCTGFQNFSLIPSKPRASFEINSLFEICTDRLQYEFKANVTLPSTIYTWKIADTTLLSGINQLYIFKNRGIFPIQLIVNTSNCRDTAISNLIVNDSALVLEPKFEFLQQLLGCNELPFVSVKSQSIGADKVVWNWDEKSTVNSDPQIVIKTPQTLEMNLLVYNGLCSKSLTKSIEVNPINPSNLLTANGDGKNDVFVIEHLPAKSKLKIKNRWGEEIFSTDNYQNNWSPPEEFSTGFYLLELPNGQSCTSWIHVEKGR